MCIRDRHGSFRRRRWARRQGEPGGRTPLNRSFRSSSPPPGPNRYKPGCDATIAAWGDNTRKLKPFKATNREARSFNRGLRGEHGWETANRFQQKQTKLTKKVL